MVRGRSAWAIPGDRRSRNNGLVGVSRGVKAFAAIMTATLAVDFGSVRFVATLASSFEAAVVVHAQFDLGKKQDNRSPDGY